MSRPPIALVIAGLVTTACVDPWPTSIRPSADPAAAPPDGKAIYNQYCVACHGDDGKGNHGLGGDYSVVLKDRDDAELMTSIQQGKKGSIGVMPPWGAILTEAQTRAVLDHVKTTYGPKN